MKKILLLFFISAALLFVCTHVRSSNNQNALNDQPDSLLTQTMPLPTLSANWERIYKKNTGSFDLPPSMEIKKGKYRTFTNKTEKIEGFDVKQIIAQQKDNNQFSDTDIERYARVMLETKYDSPNQYEELNFNIFKYSNNYINELNAIFNDQITQDLRATSKKIAAWYPVKLERVNGMSAIHVNYLLLLNNNSKVLVHMYTFQNSDRVHILTLSYPVSEASRWESSFKTILESFRINTNR